MYTPELRCAHRRCLPTPLADLISASRRSFRTSWESAVFVHDGLSFSMYLLRPLIASGHREASVLVATSRCTGSSSAPRISEPVLHPTPEHELDLFPDPSWKSPAFSPSSSSSFLPGHQGRRGGGPGLYHGRELGLEALEVGLRALHAALELLLLDLPRAPSYILSREQESTFSGRTLSFALNLAPGLGLSSATGLLKVKP